MTDRLKALERAVRAAADPKKIEGLRRFFKTGKGEYGEGDVFAGLMVPTSRQIAADFFGLPLADIATLLHSKIHEERFIALVILAHRYACGDEALKQCVFDFYLAQTSGIDNWDLVDTSAGKIVGEHLRHRSKRILKRLIRSEDIWERRIAIVASMAFLRDGDLKTTFDLAQRLFMDDHDLMHKATGWALREAYKADPKRGRAFIIEHAASMPRTTLRYAIERMPKAERDRILAIKKKRRSRETTA